MEAFKLLSRSTNLKLGLESSDRGKPHIPSEGKVLQTTSGTDVENGDLSTRANTGRMRKRKRDDNVPDKSSANEASGDHGPTVKTLPLSATGKASHQGSNLDVPDGSLRIPEAECRSILKSHKVKVSVVLGDLSNTRSAISPPTALGKKDQALVGQRSQKRHKEASRLHSQPMRNFQLLSTRYHGPRTLLHNIYEQGYTVPTEVQLATIPLLLDAAQAGLQLPPDSSEVDLLTVAPTGSGKTLAFLAPLIHKIVLDHHQSKRGRPNRHFSALIVAPTKELVAQIVNEGRKLCVNTGVSITAIRKGMHVDAPREGSDHAKFEADQNTKPGAQLSIVVKSDILVTTPLLLQNIVAADKTDLSSIRHLVLDEADVLLDPLFREQTLSLWNACTNPSLRISLWSATMGSNIEELTIRILNERRARLGLHTGNAVVRCVIGLKDSALPSISHRLIYTATEPGKLLGLRQLLHPSKAFDSRQPSLHLRPPFLVFTQTIERAVALHAELLYDIPAEAGGSSRMAVLHSDLSDLKRLDVMARFRKGQVWILITTDLLSRGVDFRGVNGVVNYDIPTSTAAYVHRVGRTGRAGREGGLAVTFYTRDDIKYVKAIANAIALSENTRASDGDRDDDRNSNRPTSSPTTQDHGVQQWLLNALPDIRKRDRQELKKRGVDVRRKARAGEDEQQAKAKRKTRISTKSGYDRRLENKRKGAIAGRQTRADGESEGEEGEDNGDSDAFEGFE